MARTLRLPRADGTLTPYRLTGQAPVQAPGGPIRSRIAYAAVHVVADPLADINPTLEAVLDWEATLAYRRYIWSLGLAVAEAMDTSQRGMGFDWPTAKELIRRAVAEARSLPGAVIASGAGTDHLEPGPRVAPRRRRGGVRGAVRVHRVGGGPDHPDGEPRARRVREEPGRLREGLRPPPGPGEGARDHPLARRHVRSRARRLLGLARHGPGDRDAARDRARLRAEDRRRQDLAPRSGAGDRDAAPLPQRRPDVHRRRLRLPDDDSGRRRAVQRRAPRDLR